MAKPLTQLVPDFREALEQGLEEVATQVVVDLKTEGPYWTGFFESLWQVNAGIQAIPANVKNPLEVPRQPKVKEITPFDVPKSPDLQGYTIGNRAEYRLYAMDLKPTPYARGAKNAKITAPKNWFDTYINAKMPGVVDRQLTNVFRRF